MAAYVITDVEITNAELYGEFLEKVTATVEGHGGKFVVRGGALEVVLGDWVPPRLAILQFDSVEQVKVWLSSPDYTALDDIRGRLGRNQYGRCGWRVTLFQRATHWIPYRWSSALLGFTASFEGRYAMCFLSRTLVSQSSCQSQSETL